MWGTNVIAACLVFFALTGCGGGDPSADSASTGSSKRASPTVAASYELVEIDIPEEYKYSAAMAINEHGVVAGIYSDVNFLRANPWLGRGIDRRAFGPRTHYSLGFTFDTKSKTLTRLESNDESGTFLPLDIADDGALCGVTLHSNKEDYSEVLQASVWRKGRFEEIDGAESSQMEVVAIVDANHVLIHQFRDITIGSTTMKSQVPAIWSPDGIAVHPFSDNSRGTGLSFDASSASMAVGYMDIANYPRPAVLIDGMWTLLPYPEGAFGKAYAVSASVIAGELRLPIAGQPLPGPALPALWLSPQRSAIVFSEVDGKSITSGVARAVSSRGLIAGSYSDTEGGYRAFIADKDGAHDLTNLAINRGRLVIVEVWDMNDAGEIAAVAVPEESLEAYLRDPRSSPREDHAVVLIPK